MLPVEAVEQYASELQRLLATGHAAEHAYRPALQRLMEQAGEIDAVNDPRQSEYGSPDFVFMQSGSRDLILGWAEAKNITSDLTKVEKTEQLQRYSGYANLYLTNYVEFRFFSSGSRYAEVVIGKTKDYALTPLPENYEMLGNLLSGFLAQKPQPITSGVHLAEVMGGMGRRIRTAVGYYLGTDTESNADLLGIYRMIKELLVHDLDKSKFADMYAQTLVYGLFAARYNDMSPDDFTRAEARELVPQSNPFLRQFFDHIAGANFDRRLARIVDELCELLAVSAVHEIVHKHLDVTNDESDDKDPLIHFYEDFLRAYDPAQRKKMGVYYTPLPVVRFMVRTVDEILKRDFDLPKGLVDTSKTIRTVIKQEKKVKVEFHKVQILDPAVGTATFLNEIVKFVHTGFEGQEGRWPAYAKEDLIPRLHGFELMMAPYTVAHLKLGLTLQESGVSDFGRRLGVYLTNSLEEGMNFPQNLFQFGLAEAVAQEAIQAGEIKTERPIMIVIGNPPYSGESSNKTEFAMNLVAGYKFEPGGKTKLRERNPKWINDDYVKFIAFAEAMIKKSGAGIVAMITNHGYLDNPTFRGMRWRLLQTFDAIYVLDLHGNSKKKEVAPDGSKDENVFDIQQGVAIMVGVMTNRKVRGQAAEVFYAEAWGSRRDKFALLERGIEWTPLELEEPMYLFAKRSTAGWNDYASGVPVDKLFIVSNVGVVTSADAVLIGDSRDDLDKRLRRAQDLGGSGKIFDRLRDHVIDASRARPIAYRPFDERMVYYDHDVLERSRGNVMQHFVRGDNVGLVVPRMMKEDHPGAFIARHIIGHKLFSAYDINSVFPLYVYADDGTRSINFALGELANLTANISEPYEPEDILDYIYGVLYSPNYREKYKTFLKTDFPRVPVPIGDAEFNKITGFGTQLRELHLMTSSICDNLITTYPVAGSDEIEKLRFEEGKVWINAQQYFGGVPEVAWSFFIGGYQPAQKWLKDRKGKKLSSNDIEHYQRIVTVLAKTDEIMQEIDA
jgi:hypothetical protein